MQIAYPLAIAQSEVVTAGPDAHIRQMIEQVLFTMPGERVMYPDFGVGLERLVFETTASEVTTATQSLVSAALHRWLGDVISVLDVKVAVHDSTLSIDVVYELIDTREQQSEHFEL